MLGVECSTFIFSRNPVKESGGKEVYKKSLSLDERKALSLCDVMVY
jgi:hypothetical protein